jgi:mRNA interferase MazF
MLCCPTTTRIRGYPFEATLDGDPPSVALADPIRSLDWRVRRAERKGVVNARALADIRGKAAALLGIKPS